MSSTDVRRRLVTRLVATGTIESQAQLSDLLAEEGHAVTQATISRDLEAIGARKGRDGDAWRYRVEDPVAVARARSSLSAAVDEFVESVTTTGPLVVIRVPPSAANLVAGKIDAAALPSVLGTIAGNDTVFIAVEKSTEATAVAAEIEGE